MVIQANNDQPAGRLERLGLPAPIIKPIRRASILIRRAIIFWKEPRAAIISCLRFVWKERRELRPLVNANSSVLFEGARYSADMPLLAGTDLLPEIQRDHFAEAYAPPIKIATLRNVLVSGRSCVGTHRHVYLLGNLQPDYVDEYLAKGLLDDDLAPPWKHEQNLLADDLAARIMAANSLIDRGWGKAAQLVDVQGKVRQLVEVRLSVVQPQSECNLDAIDDTKILELRADSDDRRTIDSASWRAGA